jgi:hypothetical protein
LSISSKGTPLFFKAGVFDTSQLAELSAKQFYRNYQNYLHKNCLSKFGVPMKGQFFAEKLQVRGWGNLSFLIFSKSEKNTKRM